MFHDIVIGHIGRRKVRKVWFTLCHKAMAHMSLGLVPTTCFEAFKENSPISNA
jgi:hypothetical protein